MEKLYQDLYSAVERGDIRLVMNQLNQGVDINMKYKHEDGITPLHLAVINGHQHLVKLLLENGANVNSTDDFGETPLGDAIFYKNNQIIETLIGHEGKLGDNYSSLFQWTEVQEIVDATKEIMNKRKQKKSLLGKKA